MGTALLRERVDVEMGAELPAEFRDGLREFSINTFHGRRRGRGRGIVGSGFGWRAPSSTLMITAPNVPRVPLMYYSTLPFALKDDSELCLSQCSM